VYYLSFGQKATSDFFSGYGQGRHIPFKCGEIGEINDRRLDQAYCPQGINHYAILSRLRRPMIFGWVYLEEKEEKEERSKGPMRTNPMQKLNIPLDSFKHISFNAT